MNSLKRLRLQTGFSQYEMAGCFGISRSMINMIERDVREFAGDAGKKHTNILLYLEQAISPVQKEHEWDNTDLEKFGEQAKIYQKKLEGHEYNIASMKIQLRKMKAMHELLLSKLNFIAGIENVVYPLYEKSSADDKWIDFHRSSTERKISRYDFVQQQILEDKIDIELTLADIHKKKSEKYSLKLNES